MKQFIRAFLLLGCGSTAAAQSEGYTRTSAPWSDLSYEVCSKAEGSDFRPVVFKPKIEEWTYTETKFQTVKFVATENGISEVPVKDEHTFPAYFLVGQKIGYLDDDNK